MNTDTKIKQRITIPDDIHKLGNILALDCVTSLNKSIRFNSFWLVIDNAPYDLNVKSDFAYPGDDLVELENGKWIVVKT